MKGYKAFKPGFYCEHGGNKKQYFENSIAEDTGANGCGRQGVMHFCEAPLDTLDYYPLIDDGGKMTEFAEVEPLDEVYSEGNKHATRKLKIGAKLSFKDIVAAQVDVVFKKAEHAKKDGVRKLVSQLAASGDDSKLAASGDDSKLAASGGNSQLAASGDDSQLAASGDDSQLAASGWNSQLAASGGNSIAAAIGRNSIVKAAIGNWIALAEYGKYDGKCYPVLCVKSAQIDGETLRPGTWYALKNGEFVEVKE